MPNGQYVHVATRRFVQLLFNCVTNEACADVIMVHWEGIFKFFRDNSAKLQQGDPNVMHLFASSLGLIAGLTAYEKHRDFIRSQNITDDLLVALTRAEKVPHIFLCMALSNLLGNVEDHPLLQTDRTVVTEMVNVLRVSLDNGRYVGIRWELIEPIRWFVSREIFYFLPLKFFFFVFLFPLSSLY